MTAREGTPGRHQLLHGALVARILGVHRSTVSRWWNAGKLPYRDLPVGRRTTAADLERWLGSRPPPPKVEGVVLRAGACLYDAPTLCRNCEHPLSADGWCRACQFPDGADPW